MKHQGIKTPTICNIFDTEGELAAAVASVEAVVSSFFDVDFVEIGFFFPFLFAANLYMLKNRIPSETYCVYVNSIQEKFLTSSWIQQSKQNIFSAPVMMVDANLSLPALKASCQCTCSISVHSYPPPLLHILSLALVNDQLYANHKFPCFYFLVF